MPVHTAPAKATWVRVRLATPRTSDTALTEGEIVLRADRVTVDSEHVVFLCAGHVVFRLERCYFRAITWFVDRPSFAEWLAGRRAQFPNSHTRWSGGEREQLADEVAAGWGWQRISEKHGRTITAVERQAVADKLERN